MRPPIQHVHTCRATQDLGVDEARLHPLLSGAAAGSRCKCACEQLWVRGVEGGGWHEE